MRKTFLLISTFLMLVLLAVFGLYMYYFDYGVERIGAKGGRTSAFGTTSMGMQIRARLLQQRLSGLTCPLILTVRNENSQPVEIPKSGLSLNLLLSDGQGFTRRLNISGAVRDGWKCTVPPRAEKMPGSLCEFTVDVFEQVGDLPEGEYEMRVLMDFDMDKGKVSLSSELATLVVPVRRDR